MTPILFYGVPEGCSFGSIVALEWTGAPYRLCRIDMPGTVSSNAYGPINPVHETPSLMLPNGHVLSESMAILNHIAARTVAKGWGFEPKSEKFDRLNQMLAFLNTSFFNAFSPLWHVVEHELEASAKEVIRAYGIAKVEKAHAQLETLLGGRDWLVGEEKSLADAYFAGIARWNDFHQAVDRRQFPAVSALYDRLQGDAAMRFAWAIEHEAEAKTTGQFLGHVTLQEALGEIRQAA
ncbi:glutathione S-transferase family protein [Rhizobium terrae]|uniref:glutathione S-transferase family protein n=1 Tax=Rhizobium terrae TaxID=2171756 RepID=UPI000E3B8F7D|nr:glutathione S-transferase family protein [Rhizobium terrae]